MEEAVVWLSRILSEVVMRVKMDWMACWTGLLVGSVGFSVCGVG